jgi:hypothetical protein
MGKWVIQQSEVVGDTTEWGRSEDQRTLNGVPCLWLVRGVAPCP